MLLSRCVSTVAVVSVVVRIPAAGVLAVAVGPAIVGVLAVVCDSVVVDFPAFAASLLVLPSLLLLCLCCQCCRSETKISDPVSDPDPACS